MKHGFGTYVWDDGQRYEGEWLNGKQHGEGFHISVEGHSRKGVWN